jgi:hypothetical protein
MIAHGAGEKSFAKIELFLRARIARPSGAYAIEILRRLERQGRLIGAGRIGGMSEARYRQEGNEPEPRSDAHLQILRMPSKRMGQSSVAKLAQAIRSIA